MNNSKSNDILAGFIPGMVLAAILVYFINLILFPDLGGFAEGALVIFLNVPSYLFGIIIGLIIGRKQEGNMNRNVFISTTIGGALIPTLVIALWLISV